MAAAAQSHPAHPEGRVDTDIFSATSVADIHHALAELQLQEAHVTERLNDLIASQKDLSRELGRVDLLRSRLSTTSTQTRHISTAILHDASTTASRISSQVRKLDFEQANVKSTLEVVEQVAELKACVLGVVGSMGAPQDWETAAGYLQRASRIPREVVEGSFAEEIVPSAEVPDAPRVTLDEAAESLCRLFLREFEKATKEGDGAQVTRFFKLFPLIGRSEVGLDAYGRYVCTGVASRARSNFNNALPEQRKDPFFYAHTITQLFEHIAQIVDSHEPLVERHYGPGSMGRVVERLQFEADTQGGIVLDTWFDERGIERKLVDIKAYAFSFLVKSQMALAARTQGGLGGTPRSGSPAARTSTSEDEGVDMKEVDAVLAEAAHVLGRWALYERFIASKCPPRESPDPPGIDHGLTVPPFIADSHLQKKISTLLATPFNEFTTFFFRRSVEKAFQLDEFPADLSLNPAKPLHANPPFISSAVDDVMYIVNQMLQRILATSQRGVVGSSVPALARVLTGDFIPFVQRKMRDECYPKPAVQGQLPPEDKVIPFLVLINNLDIANSYLHRIVSTHLGLQSDAGPEAAAAAATQSDPRASEAHLKHLFPFGHDAVFVATTLRNLEKTVTEKSNELLRDGIRVVFENILRPRIRPILSEAFKDITYDPPSPSSSAVDDDVDSPDDPDLVRARFDRAWNAVIRPLRRILTSPSFSQLQSLSCSYLASALEKRIFSYYGKVNELGAVRLERDVSGVVQVAVQGGKWGLRDAFSRVGQMCLVLNMEEEEWDEVVREGEGGLGGLGSKEEAGGVKWVIDGKGRREVRGILVRGGEAS